MINKVKDLKITADIIFIGFALSVIVKDFWVK